ncbi:MAG: hypothetical protein UX89_C0003G0023 [Parcubacteria group bacterium GW2011_GWA2_47_16]|nr:MAG: hypothetical protein UX89_C0003G0023 [Parcubacteria group bacterium GW2011_GWA2_47_16]
MADDSRDDGYDNDAKFVMAKSAEENFQNVTEKIAGKTYRKYPRETTEKIKKEKRPHFDRRHTETKRHEMSKTVHKSHRVGQKKATRAGNFFGHNGQFAEKFILSDQLMSIPPPQKEKRVVARKRPDK